MEQEKLKRLQQLVNAMATEREDYLASWKDLAHYILPQRYANFTDKENRTNSLLNPNVIDSSGLLAARVLSNGMRGAVVPENRKWFSFSRPDGDEVEATEDEKKYFDELADVIHRVISNTNFYSAMSTMFLDYVIFGNAAMVIYDNPEDSKRLFSCYTPALGSFGIDTDSLSNIEGFSRNMLMKGRDILARFPDMEEGMRLTISNAQEKKYQVFSLTTKNTGEEMSTQFEEVEYFWLNSAAATDGGMPAFGKGNFLGVSGWYERGYVVPRWEIMPDSSWGVGPGTQALPFIKQLQEYAFNKAVIIDAAANPAMIADSQMAGVQDALLPGSITYVNNLNETVGAKAVHTSNYPLAQLDSTIADLLSKIEKVFYNELFRSVLDLDTVRSAAEISVIQSEKFSQLGSVVTRFEHDVLGPVITRVVGIASRAGILPKQPDTLEELELRPISLLAEAQSATVVNSIQRFMALIGGAAQLDPSALDNMNTDAVVRSIVEGTDVDRGLLRSKDEVEGIRQQRQEAEQIQQVANAGPGVNQAVQGAVTAGQAIEGGNT